MYDIDHDTIKNLFYEHFSELTKKANSFDFQFSDGWVSEARDYC